MSSRLSSPGHDSFVIHEDAESHDHGEQWIPADKGAFRIRYVHDDSVLSYDPENDDEEEEEDPFDDSELSEQDVSFNSMTTNSDGHQALPHDRIVSNATAIPDGYVSTFRVVRPSIESFGQDENIDDNFGTTLAHGDDKPEETRKPSDTFSALPEEMQYYRSSLPGSELRSPLSRSRSQHLNSSNPGSPRLISVQPAQQQPLLLAQGMAPFSHSNSATYRKGDERPIFRNPSSVREMQMSSPPPFASPSPPRSARHRRHQTAVFSPTSPSVSSSRTGSPLRQHTPSGRQSPGYEHLHGSNPGTPTRKHPDPRKEYPLVLLHCTLAPLPILSQYTSQQLAAVLPTEKQKDFAALTEKLGPTVMERGILLTHPGDDYDLLEERILESLELETPRLGSCGHHRSAVDAQHASASVTFGDHVCDPTESNGEDQCHSQCANKCLDCGKHISTKLTSGERRWDVRIYAANGLMRAGVWSAAWKEMERVDVEIGIALSESMRRALDDCRTKEAEQSITLGNAATAPINAMSVSASAGIADAMDNAASTAELSRSSSSASNSAPGVKRNPRSLAVQQREDLSTLLFKFVVRNFEQNRDRLVLGSLICLGIWVAFAMGSHGKDAISPIDLGTPSSVSAELTTLQAENEELKRLLSQVNDSTSKASLDPSVTAFISTPTVTITETITATIVESNFAGSAPFTDPHQEQYAAAALKALAGRTMGDCHLSCICDTTDAVEITEIGFDTTSNDVQIDEA